MDLPEPDPPISAKVPPAAMENPILHHPPCADGDVKV